MSAFTFSTVNTVDLEIQEGFLSKLAEDAMLQQRLLVNNPRELSRDQALAIYQAAF
jgi:alcohol dehydrogenase class IV